MRLTLVVSTLLVAFSSNPAGAEPGSPSPDGYLDPDRPITTFIPIDESQADIRYPDADQPLSHGTHTLYVNPCWGGEVYTPGSDDSRNNRSSILSSTRSMPEYAYGSSQFAAVVACVREMMGPFNITVVDTDPGSAPHHEAVVCGHPSDAGFNSQTGGVAPFSCGVIENSITFTFPELWGNSPRTHCEVVAQEAAHAWGLDHELLCQDPMTYLTGCGAKTYQNQYANCGEFDARGCYCGGSQQNSVQHILSVFGSAEASPPNVNITEPLPNATVSGGFIVRADISDDQGIQDASLYVDDQLITTISTPPYVFNGPDSLADGSHEVTVLARDIYNASGSDSIFVIVGEPCGGNGDCNDAEVCIDGRCVPGPDAEGGLGDECESGADCFSGLCGADGDGNKYCTEPCNPDDDGCPSGFECKTAGDGGVCWPGGGGGASGGCGVAAGERGAPWAALVLIGLFGAVLLRRRRG